MGGGKGGGEAGVGVGGERKWWCGGGWGGEDWCRDGWGVEGLVWVWVGRRGVGAGVGREGRGWWGCGGRSKVTAGRYKMTKTLQLSLKTRHSCHHLVSCVRKGYAYLQYMHTYIHTL